VAFTDIRATFRLALHNGALVSSTRPEGDPAPAGIRITKDRLRALLGGDTESTGLDTTGDGQVLRSLLGVLDAGRSDLEHRHPVATPKGHRCCRHSPGGCWPVAPSSSAG
jgi:alkyl sulfatase BDS1-like metallo-beta-lactamase superfamily hydrolase